MRIKIVGAAGGEVTGSAYVVQTRQATVIIDAGMFQGGKKSEGKNRLPRGVDPSKLDAVLLTHAHLDHTGRVPLLIKHGFKKRIFATAPTIDLAELVLQDSARLQAQDAERANRRHRYSDLAPVEPLYAPEDVEPFRRLASAVRFGESIRVADGMTARWVEAGHMLGSASIELTIDEEDNRKRIIVFSGDLGPTTLPIVRSFESPTRADVVFLESTYGDRDHRPYDQTIAEFETAVRSAVASKGKILVPTFAIGRSQQILYHLAIMFRSGKIQPFHVYLDSPMAIKASATMVKYPDLFDEEMLEWKERGLLPLDKTWFHPSVTARDSHRLNEVEGPCLILAGAGMCNGGRILHHFANNLHRENTDVLIVGYQGKGSLGRRLVEGARSVSIYGEQVTVRAKVRTLNGFSAHAGQSDLLKWFSRLAEGKPKVFLTHGEQRPRSCLSQCIRERFGLVPHLPSQGDVVET
jgi:metallo-beta-lactamase family protein